MKNYVAFSGSLQKKSLNTALLHGLIELKGEGVNIEVLPIGNLPLFNQDLEPNPPTEVTLLKQKIENSDGVIFVTPEYNRSIPGVLKNAIDWASRPYGKNSFAGKKALVMGATGGSIGTSLAQQHLKSILLYLDMRVIGQPELYIGGAVSKFDENMKLIDETTIEHLKKALGVFEAF
jgi:chromate reductase